MENTSVMGDYQYTVLYFMTFKISMQYTVYILNADNFSKHLHNQDNKNIIASELKSFLSKQKVSHCKRNESSFYTFL